MEAFWKKIQFWKKPKMLEEGKEFRYVNFENTDITGVELLTPEYLGVVFHYGKVKVVEDNGIARLQFGYTLVHAGKHDMDTLNSDEKFYTIMGDILTYILMAKEKDEARNNDFEEPDFF